MGDGVGSGPGSGREAAGGTVDLSRVLGAVEQGWDWYSHSLRAYILSLQMRLDDADAAFEAAGAWGDRRRDSKGPGLRVGSQ